MCIDIYIYLLWKLYLTVTAKMWMCAHQLKKTNELVQCLRCAEMSTEGIPVAFVVHGQEVHQEHVVRHGIHPKYFHLESWKHSPGEGRRRRKKHGATVTAWALNGRYCCGGHIQMTLPKYFL